MFQVREASDASAAALGRGGMGGSSDLTCSARGSGAGAQPKGSRVFTVLERCPHPLSGAPLQVLVARDIQHAPGHPKQVAPPVTSHEGPQAFSDRQEDHSCPRFNPVGRQYTSSLLHILTAPRVRSLTFFSRYPPHQLRGRVHPLLASCPNDGLLHLGAFLHVIDRRVEHIRNQLCRDATHRSLDGRALPRGGHFAHLVPKKVRRATRNRAQEGYVYPGEEPTPQTKRLVRSG